MVIEYLRQTKDLPHVLKVDKTKSDVWSIAAVYAVHADCKSHNGASYTMGQGCFSVSPVSRRLIVSIPVKLS